MNSIDAFQSNLIDKYHAKLDSKSRTKRKYIINDYEIMQSLFSSDEKKKFAYNEQEIFNAFGYIPTDEYINIGKYIEIIVYLHKGSQIDKFEISPICNLLFEQLIVMIGYDDLDKKNQTSKYKRYLAAESYVKNNVALSTRIDSYSNHVNAPKE